MLCWVNRFPIVDSKATIRSLFAWPEVSESYAFSGIINNYAEKALRQNRSIKASGEFQFPILKHWTMGENAPLSRRNNDRASIYLPRLAMNDRNLSNFNIDAIKHHRFFFGRDLFLASLMKFATVYETAKKVRLWNYGVIMKPDVKLALGAFERRQALSRSRATRNAIRRLHCLSIGKFIANQGCNTNNLNIDFHRILALPRRALPCAATPRLAEPCTASPSQALPRGSQ